MKILPGNTTITKGTVTLLLNYDSMAFQERNVVDVAKDVAKLFDLPDSKITYVKDRAFNDQCASSCLHNYA